MAAKPSSAPWGSLRVDLLRRILDRLPCLAHRADFAAVCFNWRFLTCAHPPPRQQLPWLLLPSAGTQRPTFFCILCRSTHRAALPDDVRAARCCGSFPSGWLVLALEQFSGYALHNLITGERVLLPYILVSPGADDRAVLVVHAAAQTREPNGLAAAMSLSASNIAFWRPGMDHWLAPTPAMAPPGPISDAVYYSGHGLEGFHVLTDTEELLVYVPDPGRGALTTSLVTCRFPNHRVTPSPPVGKGAITRYLLDYSGQLMMVVRAVSAEGKTLTLRVFRLTEVMTADLDGNRLADWVEIQVPAGLVFLGRCSSRVYCRYGLGIDGFYFLDDATSLHDVTMVLRPTRQYPCSDMGVVPPLSNQAQLFFPPRMPSEYSRAAWFFH